MRKMDTSFIAVIMVVLFWGFWGFFYKIGTAKIGLERATFWAFLTFLVLDAVILTAIVFYQKIPFTTGGGVVYMIVGSIASVIGTLFFISYLRKASLSIAIPLTALYPAVTTVLAILILKEKIKLANAAGILLAIAAGVLLA